MKNENYKKTVIIEKYTIGVCQNGSIEVSIDGKPCGERKAKPLLRDEIAPMVNFDVNLKWNTRELGNKLIDFVNSNKIVVRSDVDTISKKYRSLSTGKSEGFVKKSQASAELRKCGLAESARAVKRIKCFLEKLSKRDVSVDGYSEDKKAIKVVFKKTSNKISREVILARIALIDGMYSTQMNKRYYALGDIADALHVLEEKKCLKDIFTEFTKDLNISIFEIDDMCSKSNPNNNNLWGRCYGIGKLADEKGVAVSLISKYAYFETDCNFPIYDSIACEVFPLIWNKVTNETFPTLRVPKSQKLDGKETIQAFVKAINKIKDYIGYEINDFYDMFDRLMWYVGKIRRGNMSLILSKADYQEWANIAKIKIKDFKIDVSNEKGWKEVFQKIDVNELKFLGEKRNSLLRDLYIYAKELD